MRVSLKSLWKFMMNEIFGGLNKDKCKQVDCIVIAAFNLRAQRHAGDGCMKLSLERAGLEPWCDDPSPERQRRELQTGALGGHS